MAKRDMGQLGCIEVRQYYSKWYHRLINRKTFELIHKDKTYFFDSRSKVWSGKI